MVSERTVGLSFPNRQHLVVGSLLGSIAYLVNYTAMAVFLFLDGASWEDVWSSHQEANPMVTFVGQTLYNAQFIGIRFEDDSNRVETVNFITDVLIQENISNTVPRVAYHAAPIIVCMVAGYVLFLWMSRRSSRVSATTIGLSIFPGYLFLTIGGVAFFEFSSRLVMSRPDPGIAIVLVGIGYPVVWGTIGATVGSVVHSEGIDIASNNQ